MIRSNSRKACPTHWMEIESKLNIASMLYRNIMTSESYQFLSFKKKPDLNAFPTRDYQEQNSCTILENFKIHSYIIQAPERLQKKVLFQGKSKQHNSLQSVKIPMSLLSKAKIGCKGGHLHRYNISASRSKQLSYMKSIKP